MGHFHLLSTPTAFVSPSGSLKCVTCPMTTSMGWQRLKLSVEFFGLSLLCNTALIGETNSGMAFILWITEHRKFDSPFACSSVAR